MKTLLGLVVFALPPGGVALAQIAEGYGHHLEPEDSQYIGGFPDGYDFAEHARIVSTVFKDAFGSDVLARVVVTPSRSPEYALGINRVQGQYKVFALRSSKHLWAYMSVALWKRNLEQITGALATQYEREWRQRGIELFEAEFPPDFRDVEINRCEVGIDASLGAQVVELWRQMLLQTRYTDHSNATVLPGTLDGTTFHFWGRGMSGATRYIAAGSNVDLLARVTGIMNRLCSTADPSAAAQLQGETGALLSRLQQ